MLAGHNIYAPCVHSVACHHYDNISRTYVPDAAAVLKLHQGKKRFYVFIAHVRTSETNVFIDSLGPRDRAV